MQVSTLNHPNIFVNQPLGNNSLRLNLHEDEKKADLHKANQEDHLGDDPRDPINFIRKNYPKWFNWATVLLHTLGAVLPFVSFIPQKLSQTIKSTAIEFSRWCIPIVKIHNGIEALKGKKIFEALARIVPVSFLPILPFFNFQLAYGLSSGINVTLEHIYNRIGDLKAEDGFKENTQKVINGFWQMFKDLKNNSSVSKKEKTKLALTLGGAACMVSGAIPALLFARNSVNNTIAKIFGSVRSLGGLLGDLSIILFPGKPTREERREEQIVGSFYLIPTIMDFAQRWMKQDSEANEIFNHAKTSLNTIAEVMWSHFSTKRNMAQEELASKKLHQAAA